jgi:hypothetical protein
MSCAIPKAPAELWSREPREPIGVQHVRVSLPDLIHSSAHKFQGIEHRLRVRDGSQPYRLSREQRHVSGSAEAGRCMVRLTSAVMPTIKRRRKYWSSILAIRPCRQRLAARWRFGFPGCSSSSTTTLAGTGRMMMARWSFAIKATWPYSATTTKTAVASQAPYPADRLNAAPERRSCAPNFGWRNVSG